MGGFFPYTKNNLQDAVKISYLLLLLGALEDIVLDGARDEESVDGDVTALAEPVGPVHGLLVGHRVPVRVEEDHLKFQEKSEMYDCPLGGTVPRPRDIT